MFDATALGRFQRRRFVPMLLLASVAGVCAGALGAKMYFGIPDDAQTASEPEREDLWSDGDRRRDLRAELTAQRAENGTLTVDLRRARREREHLARELSRALESVAALQADRDRTFGASAPAKPAANRDIGAPTAPPPPHAVSATTETLQAPPRQEAGLPASESVPQLPIRRIFRAKSPGIRLEDLSRHYGVSMENLKRANPDLQLEVRSAGHFLLQGANVNIPAVEE